MKIAVIDDEAMNIRILTRVLQEFGAVSGFRDADEGLDAIRLAYGNGEPFDVLFLDIMMPKMNGFDVLAAVQKMARTYSTPVKTKVVMVTSQNDRDDVLRAAHGGAVDYVLKPVDPARIRDEIARLTSPAGTANRSNGLAYRSELTRRIRTLLALGRPHYAGPRPGDEVLAQFHVHIALKAAVPPGLPRR